MLFDMRATIILEDEVTHQLEQLGRERRASLDAVANEILRDGLARRARPDLGKGGSPTRPVSLGGCLLPSLESVSEALAQAEGEAFR